MTLKSFENGLVFADLVGEGEALVVLLHGWGRDRSDLVPVTRGLPARCMLVDLPGFGTSPPPPRAWGAREYSELVEAVIEDEVGPLDEAPRPVVLVGHSFGGRVALCLAARRSAVAGLVLSGVPLLRQAGAKSPLRFRAVRLMHRRGLVGAGTMERYRQTYGSTDYKLAHGVMRETLVRLVGESYEAELRSVACPVRLVWGERDAEAPVSMARKALPLITAPHELILAEEAGHDVHYSSPELLQREILALCRSST